MDGSKEQHPDTASILAELKRILPFVNAQKPEGTNAGKLLDHVVKLTLEKRESELIERNIADDVFRKKLDYSDEKEPPNNVVRTSAGRLRSKLAQYYSRPIGQTVVISLPLGGYVPKFQWARGQESRPVTVSLRPNRETLSKNDARAMVDARDFYCQTWNEGGKGIEHKYIRPEGSSGVVSDNTTGLMWQKSDSDEGFQWEHAEEYIADLNAKKFAGFDDWRLPTLEELMSLITPAQIGIPITMISSVEKSWTIGEPPSFEEVEVKKLVHLDPVFAKAYSLWTADSAPPMEGAGGDLFKRAWAVSCIDGFCFSEFIDRNLYIKAVRSMAASASAGKPGL